MVSQLMRTSEGRIGVVSEINLTLARVDEFHLTSTHHHNIVVEGSNDRVFVFERADMMNGMLVLIFKMRIVAYQARLASLLLYLAVAFGTFIQILRTSKSPGNLRIPEVSFFYS